jgi:hypothetical protein
MGDDCFLKNHITIIKPENILQIIATLSLSTSPPITLIPTTSLLTLLFTEGYSNNPFINENSITAQGIWKTM